MKDHLYYVSIVASISRTLYTGVTSHIEGRITQHRNGTFKGFTSKYHCNRLVWYLRFPYVEDAIAYEKKLKGWTRARKIELIEAGNPTWEDLSAEWANRPLRMTGVPRPKESRSFAALRMTLLADTATFGVRPSEMK